jgi:hypothetical protein
MFRLDRQYPTGDDPETELGVTVGRAIEAALVDPHANPIRLDESQKLRLEQTLDVQLATPDLEVRQEVAVFLRALSRDLGEPDSDLLNALADGTHESYRPEAGSG